MNLYLLRHGEAKSQASSDAARPLTEEGRADIASIARQFEERDLPLTLCFASPYLRAQQSAETFLTNVSKGIELNTDAILIPEIRANKVIEFLAKLNKDNVLLVSHNPLLSELLAILLNGNLENMEIVSTAELNSLSMDVIAPAMATLSFRLNPAYVTS